MKLPEFLQPSITLIGADESTDLDALVRLAGDSDVEIGFLYSVNPEGRHRYPSFAWLADALPKLPGRVALHVCGSAARSQLQAGELSALTAAVERIQVNGSPSVSDVEFLCELYPDHTLITQHNAGNSALLRADALNHAILVDGSGGLGIVPDEWLRPRTHKQLGFAGGLGPENLEIQLPLIAMMATNPWWIALESGLRTPEDRFDGERASAAVELFRKVLATHRSEGTVLPIQGLLT